VDAGYDAFVEALPGWIDEEDLFASRYGSPDGVVMFRGERSQGFADAFMQSIGATITNADVLDAIEFELDTHPEYENVDDASQNPDALDFLTTVDAKGWTGTWAPKLFERDVDTWWLAVACASVSLDPEHPVFNDPSNPPGTPPGGNGGYHPTWAPDQVFADNYTAAMTRIFDVSDPDNPPIALATLLGPGLATTTSDLEVLKVGSSYYLFAVGYVDGVSVWDITNLSAPETVYTSSDPEYFAYWKPPKSVSDLEDGSVFDLVIDKVDEDEIWVYASVLRGGVQVLRFLPDEPLFEDRLEPTGKLIETAARTSGLTLRVDAAGEKTLIVSDLGAGIRIYGKPQ